jgi:hypothetical protein
MYLFNLLLHVKDGNWKIVSFIVSSLLFRVYSSSFFPSLPPVHTVSSRLILIASLYFLSLAPWLTPAGSHYSLSLSLSPLFFRFSFSSLLVSLLRNLPSSYSSYRSELFHESRTPLPLPLFLEHKHSIDILPMSTICRI